LYSIQQPLVPSSNQNFALLGLKELTLIEFDPMPEVERGKPVERLERCERQRRQVIVTAR
jgi:hypothetical protein